MGLEEDLLQAMKYASLGGKAPHNKLIQELMINVQVGALKQLRGELDKMIAKLAERQVKVKDAGGLNPFEILGVTPDATKEEVKKAYRKKAAEAHPDKGGSHEKMILVNAAWEAIRRLKGWHGD